MLLNLFIASQLWLMSDRTSFWDADKISKHTEFMQDSSLRKAILNPGEIKGKNILLLVHGYNNKAEEALSTYLLIYTHLLSFKAGDPSQFYDFIIGYLWPGDDHVLKYYDAKHHVSKLVKRLRSHLELFSASAAKIDVLAHSMGNRLMFEALNYQPETSKKIINHFYSFAAAVDNESLEINQKYYQSTQNCEKMFIFYSKRDHVLKYSYSFGEWDRALGYGGAEHPKKLPKNVELIDYTAFVGQHSQYFAVLPAYEFIKKNYSIGTPEKQGVSPVSGPPSLKVFQ